LHGSRSTYCREYQNVKKTLCFPLAAGMGSMVQEAMNLDAQSGMLAALVSAAVAISFLLRGRRVINNAFFAGFSANLFVHFLAAFFLGLSDHSELWSKIDLIAASALPVTSILFFGHFLWRDPLLTRPFLRGAYLISGLLVAFLLTPWSRYRVIWIIVVSYAFFSLYLCAAFVYVRYREFHSKLDRVRLRYLLFTLLIAVTFVLLGTLPGPLRFLRTWGDLVSILFLYFISQSLLKYRLLDLRDLIGRGLVLTAVALVMAAVFWVLFGGTTDLPLFHTFVASFVILILFEPLQEKLESSTKLLYFGERADLRRHLEDLRREIANIIDPQQMAKAMLDTLFDKMRVSCASIYFRDEGGASYHLVGYRGAEPPTRLDVAAHRPFFDQLQKTPTVVLGESFERRLAVQGTLTDPAASDDVKHARQVLEALSIMRAAACIPLVGQKNEMLGLWNFFDESAVEGYTTEEIARMLAVGEQAAIVIENSKMFARVRERDRLAVLGQMAAGLAHEIRNPLGAIKGAAQYLDPSAVGADSAEFLKIIIEETDRLNHVVDQFLDYARPYKTQFAETDINHILEHTSRLIQSALEKKHISLDLQLRPNLPKVQANGQQLTQVMLNLMNNAIEAMSDGGVLTIRTSLNRDDSSFWPGSALRLGALEIQISDTGPGIQPEHLERIFVPFFTTKERGTGLGLPICQRIVENHGGEIRVRSKPKEGSVFTVMLPSQTAGGESAGARSRSEEPFASEKDKTSTQATLPFPGESDRG
jgi:two-component system, NtrC family, sensor histidine kinase HydH